MQFKTLKQLRSLFMPGGGRETLDVSISHYLDSIYRQTRLLSPSEAEQQSFLERLDALLYSDEAMVRHIALNWAIHTLANNPATDALSMSLCKAILSRAREFKYPWLFQPLLAWLSQPEPEDKSDIILWLSELSDLQPQERYTLIETLLTRYLSQKMPEPELLKALKRLDRLNAEVTDVVLHQFPAKTEEQNHRIINLLGQIGRYRAIKPLISYAREYPVYLRSLMKALSRLEFDEVDQFYIQCLDPVHKSNPIILIEAIKQVRRRRLRKAIPILDSLFPVEDPKNALVSRAVNGEIALTMASFGAYVWGREKLLPEIILSGINQKYLKAVDMLSLDEAVPLLKAILLLPETPEIAAFQQQAYQICERLLTQTAGRC